MGITSSKRGHGALTVAVVLVVLVVLSVLAGMLLLGMGAQSGERYSLQSRTAIVLPPAQGRLDHMDVDLAGGRLFVVALANDTVYVASLSTGQTLARIAGLSTPQGVIYDPATDQVFVSNGGNGTVQAFDGHGYSRAATISLGADADNMRLDSSSDRVLVGYGVGGASGIAVIDAATDTVVARFGLDGHPEAFQLDTAAGLVFVNVPTAQEVEVVNYTAGGVYARWAMPAGGENFAMSLDTQDTRLFIGTRVDPRLLVLDAHTGKEVSSMSIPGGIDDLFYDEASRLVLASCADGVLVAVHQAAPDTYRLSMSVATGIGAGTSLLVPQTRTVYVAVPSLSGSPATVLVYQLVRASAGNSGAIGAAPLTRFEGLAAPGRTTG